MQQGIYERGDVAVWGRAREGFFRYRVSPAHTGFGVVVSMEKLPECCKVATKGLSMVDKGKVCAGSRYVFVEEGKDAAPIQHNFISSRKLFAGVPNQGAGLGANLSPRRFF